jgi:hypothetical protein
MIKEFFSNSNPLFKRFFHGWPIKLSAFLLIDVFLFFSFSCNKEKYRIDKELIRSLEGKFVINTEINSYSRNYLKEPVRQMDSICGGKSLLQIQVLNLDSGIIRMEFSWGNFTLWSSISIPLEPAIAIVRNTNSRSSTYYLVYRSKHFQEVTLPFIIPPSLEDFRPEPNGYFIINSFPPNDTLSIDCMNQKIQGFYFNRIQ